MEPLQSSKLPNKHPREKIEVTVKWGSWLSGPLEKISKMMMLASAWVCLTSSCFGGINYIPLLNISIPDKAVAIRPDNLGCHADRLRSQVATATSGKSKMLLGKFIKWVHVHTPSLIRTWEWGWNYVLDAIMSSPSLSLSWMRKHLITWSCTHMQVHTHMHMHTHTHASTDFVVLLCYTLLMRPNQNRTEKTHTGVYTY